MFIPACGGFASGGRCARDPRAAARPVWQKCSGGFNHVHNGRRSSGI